MLQNFFIPYGSTPNWPFNISGIGAYRKPHKYAQLFLIAGLFEALLHLQPKKPKEHWKNLTTDHLKKLMHTEGAGKEHPSRSFCTTLFNDNDTVLDVGCGAGANFEVFQHVLRQGNYTGIDSSSPSVEIAKELYPNGDFRLGSVFDLKNQFGENSFDVVVARHVLEHLPDFENAMEQIVSTAKRIAIIIFFLTPRVLPLGIRKINPRIDRPFLTNIYSIKAIEEWLANRKLKSRWHHNVGESRAGWLSGETNSVLVLEK